MDESFKTMDLVPDEALQNRLAFVHSLSEEDHEVYEIQKDNLTGEHYLHYAYVHINLKESGAEETYHQLMPLEHDDVIALIFGEQDYRYPQAWDRKFLRNGPNGFYVWFEPAGTAEEQSDSRKEREIVELLTRFKQQGGVSESSAKRLLDDIGRIME